MEAKLPISLGKVGNVPKMRKYLDRPNTLQMQIVSMNVIGDEMKELLSIIAARSCAR